MTIKTFFLILPLAIALFTCNPRPEKQLPSKPNILLILADDLGWSDLGCYGGEIATPHLDNLANNGVRFTQFYNTSKCFPSRASLLTGMYAHQVGAGKTWKNPWTNSTTIGEVLQTAGYKTFWSGKHHGVDHPEDLGFDDYYGLFSGACNHFNPGEQRPGEPVPAQKRMRKWVIGDQVFEPYTPESKDFYTTDVFTDAALQWLDDYEKSEEPFFLYLSYTAPHDPLMAWPNDIAKYRGKYKEGYEVIRAARFEKQKSLGLIDQDFALSESTFDDWNSLSPDKQDQEDLKMAVFAAMVDRMDQNIGRVIQKLKDQQKFENTLILFLSDNGSSAEVVEIEGTGEIGTVGQWTSLGRNWANVSNTPFKFYKNFSYEGGINTPAIVHWPKMQQSGHIEKEHAGHFIDVLPTLIDVTGANYPLTTDSRPILPLEGQSLGLQTGKVSLVHDQPLFWEWQDGKAMREGKWKIVLEGSELWELYDLENDPGETNNLADQLPEKVNEMNEKFVIWQTRMKRNSPDS